MYEEDQQTVLSMYGELFDAASDEAELASFMGSPTRQAVSLARTYNSRERKLQINSTSRADDMYEEDEDTPGFIQVLTKLGEDAEERGLLSKKHTQKSVWDDTPTASEPAIPFVPAESEVPVLFAPEKAEESVAEEQSADIEYVEPDDKEIIFEDIPPLPVREKAVKAEKVNKDWTIESGEIDKDIASLKTPNEPGMLKTEDKETARRTNIPLAVLYAIFAVPITLVLACVLLVPTFASLGVSGLCLYVGSKVAMAAFGGFSMFSDLMVVMGCGVIILALGLLFLWLFIWFVGGVIAGLINAVIELGSKWCSREVS